MAYACEICGKGKQFGHNVPFSQKKTNKVWKPNLQRTRMEIDGTRVQVKVCTQCLRTLAKYQRQAGAAAAAEGAPKPAAASVKAKAAVRTGAKSTAKSATQPTTKPASGSAPKTKVTAAAKQAKTAA